MIPKFLRPEVFPFLSVEQLAPTPAPSADALRARLTDSAPPPKARVICAWCPDFDPTLHVAGMSHGMCQACSDRLIFEAMKRAERRAEPRDEPRDDDDDLRDEDGGSTCGTACGYCGRCS